MYQLSSTYNCFLKSLVKNGWEQINPLCLKADNPSLDPIEQRYRIHNKKLYQIITHHLNISNSNNYRVAHLIRTENNDLIKMFTFHNTLNKRLGGETPINTRKISELEDLKFIFLENRFNRKIL